MSEKGRLLIEGTNYVFYTNKFLKTGGSWWFGGVHNENYYSVDVPRFISFFCRRPSWLGGETGLVDMRGVYQDLDSPLKKTLEESVAFVGKFDAKKSLRDTKCPLMLLKTRARSTGSI